MNIRLNITGLVILTISLVILVTSCGGSGGASSGTAPSISNLSYSPTAAYVNDGGGEIDISGTFDFVDPDGDLNSLIITVQDSNGQIVQSETITIGGVSGLKSGTIQGLVTIPTTVSGDYRVQIYVIDTAGLRSNSLESGFLISESPWVPKTPMPVSQSGFSTAVINGLVYVIGGSDGNSDSDWVQVYNPATDTWVAGPSLPVAVSSPMTETANGKIYAIGGWTGPWSTDITNIVQEFDPATQTWTLKTNMPDQRAYAATAVHNGLIYIVAGYGPGVEYASLLWYSPAMDAWSTGSPMSHSRRSSVGATIDGNILVYGGYSTTYVPNAGYFRSLESYNPEMDTWMSKADGKAGIAFGVTVFNNLMYVFGGNTWEGSKDWVDAYDISTDQWTSKTPMPLSLGSAHAETIGDKIYVFHTDTTLEYTPSNDIR